MIARTPLLLAILMNFSIAATLTAQPAGAPFSFIAIGDAGEDGPELLGNARHMLETARQYDAEGHPVSLLLFLGDNFYPNGLNRSEEVRRHLIRDILGPHMELMKALGRDNVHAVPGNHDYYCTTVNKIPYGACDRGNHYESEIETWVYHPHYPAILRRAVASGSSDSVDIILFDSALLLTQQIDRWSPVLDSLERLLRASAASPGVAWRLIAAHHSPYSVGEHGGYRLWLSGEKRVGYIGNCLEDMQDPFKYVEEFVSHQDNCTDRYRAYSDSLMAVIGRSGAKVQALFAGHDHSLQLMNYQERNCANCPKVFVITGAGAKRTRVKSPNPPREYTHPINTSDEKGRSAAGFTTCTFEDGVLAIRFVDSETGKVLPMGGSGTFRVDRSGKLLEDK
jgi:Calcineurin-like phosphoesterase